MKNQIMLLAMIMLSNQKLYALTNSKDLSFQCDMKAKVTDISQVLYNKGLPARGRFSGTEPSVHFSAHLEIISATAGCANLKSKYDIYVGNPTASAGYSASQESDIEQAYSLKNQIVDLKLNQYIGYQIGENYLPLFPLIHSESLSLAFNNGNISGTVNLPFNLNWVYQVKTPKQMLDIEKLSLAEKVSNFVFSKNNNSVRMQSEYSHLFLELEPQQASLKKSYALLIWKMFNIYKQSSKYSLDYLQFHVGGVGAFDGQPLAVKLNQISHVNSILTAAETVQLLADFPTWILAGNSGNSCLNFTAEDLEKSLVTIQMKLPVMTERDKYALKAPMSQLAATGFLGKLCTENKVSEKSKVLAIEILESI